MDEFRTITDIVAAYLAEGAELEREELAAELRALAAAFHAAQRFDDSPGGVVDSDSPQTGL